MYFAFNSFSNNTRVPVIRWVTNTINVLFNLNVFVSTQVTQLFRSNDQKFFSQ